MCTMFNYNPSTQNLAVVKIVAYNNCSIAGSRPLTSGSVNITPSKGRNYFVCNSPSNCTVDMKIAVIAT